MRLEKYKLEFNANKTVFEFISEGPKGNILKSVHYTKMKVKGIRNIYNLAFGDKNNDTGDIDDNIVTDNKDREKVLATVVNTLTIFIEKHPKAQVFIQGSTPVRTRLYQMAITKYFEEFTEIFDIQGFTQYQLSPFKKNVKYNAFLIRKKMKNEK
jgi:hypothetical protein